MNHTIAILLILSQLALGNSIHAQDHFKVKKINLPADISYYDNQFSSSYISRDNLFLMSESRIEDNSPSFVAYTSLQQLKKAIKNPEYMPVFHRISMQKLDTIKDILKVRNQAYEGLEAMVIDKNTYYFSIETNTPSDSCYIIKGILVDSTIQLQTNHFLAIAKPKNKNGKAIYNTGFESMEINDNKLYAFFEYNYFQDGNYVIQADLSLDANSLKKIPIEKIPFRVTDVSWDDKTKCYWGINYFFQGGGGDTVYRIKDKKDPNYSLMYTDTQLRSYCRIIQIKKEKDQFTYQHIADLPPPYWAYNWEGLVKYKGGFFISNDKYTPKRPYESELLFLENK